MDISRPGEAGVIAWCNKMRFTIAQDPGRQFMAQHIQDAFDFLDSYMEDVMAGPSQSTSSLADLMKTPGRRKAAASKTKHAHLTTSKVSPVTTLSEENIAEQENHVPASSLQKASIPAKETKPKAPPSPTRLTSLLRDVGPIRTEKSQSPIAQSRPHKVVTIMDSPVSDPEDSWRLQPTAVDMLQMEPALPMPADLVMKNSQALEIQTLAEDILQAPATHVKELSIIAEDDEFAERSHISMLSPPRGQELRTEHSRRHSPVHTGGGSDQNAAPVGVRSMDVVEHLPMEKDESSWEPSQQRVSASTSAETFHSITLSSSKEFVPSTSSSEHLTAPLPRAPPPQPPADDPYAQTAPLPSTSSAHDFTIRTSNSQQEDITVPLRDAIPGRTPGLARKPSMPQFTGLPAPSPLRKSMRVPQDAVVPLSTLATHTAAPTMPGGKRSSWLVKAREAHAMEGTGKRPSAFNSAPGVSGLLGTKRKSGDMLGVPIVPSTSGHAVKTVEDTERAAKLRKLAEPSEDAKALQTHQKDQVALVEEVAAHSEAPVQTVRIRSPPPQSRPARTTVEDQSEPIAKDDEVLNRFKKTVEGFGARTGKSMGKSLGGTAAAALAEARAAAEARVAQRNRAEIGSPEAADEADAATEDLRRELAPAVSRESSRNASLESAGRDGLDDRRLSVSDLVGTSGKEQKMKQSVEALQPPPATASNSTADANAQGSANTSTSTTPPHSPPGSRKPSFTAPTGPVFTKPPPVFVAPPPAAAAAQASRALPSVPSTSADFSFKLPAPHPFSLPATTLGIPASIPSSSGQGGLHPKSIALSAQSSKASIFSDGIFDKEDGIPAWMPSTQDTDYSIGPSQLRATPRDSIDDDDSWHVDDKFAANQMWTPFGFNSADKDDTMTWSTLPSRSTSQKGGDTGPVQPTENLTRTSYRGDDTEALDARQVERDIVQHTATSAFDFAAIANEQEPAEEKEDELEEVDMDIDEVVEEAEEVGSDIEDVILNGKQTVSLVKSNSQSQMNRARSQSQQSNASTASSSQSQLGFFSQASKLVSSVLGGSKKAEPVKSLQLAAAAAKKQQEELGKKAARMKEMENRRQLAMQRKVEEDKARAMEEERKIKEENERRKREREEHTEKKPIRGPVKKGDDDNAKKRKIVTEADKKPESKKPPSKDKKDNHPPRIGKPSAAPGSAVKTGTALKSALRQPGGPGHTATTIQHGPSAASSSSKPGPASEAKTKTLKPSASSTSVKIVSKAAGKAPTRDDDDVPPSQVLQNQMANRVKAQIHAAQPQSQPTVTSESIELPDINSEYSDSEDEDRPRTFDPPEWAQSPELRNALQQQSTLNPDDIFGRIGPLRMEEIFRTRQSRFRARTSSANWTGTDQLTAEEERDYARRMGFR
ncbi:hypothetical protein OBBRIDRAFT_819794 [Obba rivulosa]|uniref:Inner centromere protein ARK-binding domain-containing protein n=1 Tax=Obba rivulosa TaxID=1052685 RepID=A0A8E2DIH4_9APHY|nr:hypothetical protein OBBRIDRAFT_819794 [Obba rivulosa]